MPWNSGAEAKGLSERRRGPRAAVRHDDDVNDQTSFATIAAIGAGWTNQKNRPERISLGMSPIPKDHDYKTTPGIWAPTAAGTFDYFYQGFAATLAASGRTDLIVRLGWEANHINRAWYCGADKDNYILTFQRIVTILRAAVPTVTIEWCCMKKGAQKDSITNYYPGNDYVDLIGVNYYDVWPSHINQAAWDKQFMMQYPSIKKGLPPPVQGPWGLGQWLAFAVANGKKLAISEWAIWVGGTNGASVDNPFFITKMFEFFTNNQANIAYENYFNQKATIRSCRAT